MRGSSGYVHDKAISPSDKAISLSESEIALGETLYLHTICTSIKVRDVTLVLHMATSSWKHARVTRSTCWVNNEGHPGRVVLLGIILGSTSVLTRMVYGHVVSGPAQPRRTSPPLR
eukprot:3232862-Rhodomonas_salina.1